MNSIVLEVGFCSKNYTYCSVVSSVQLFSTDNRKACNNITYVHTLASAIYLCLFMEDKHCASLLWKRNNARIRVFGVWRQV